MDKASFARRVEELLLDKELARKMGLNALKLASTQFDFSNYISALERALEGLVQKQGEKVTV
jgi:glycosyltransferase involved in cell wall biosynthesis